MSHEIDTTTGRAAVFVTATPAWHGLGAVIQHATTSREAIGLAGLDWTVEQWPVYAVHRDGDGMSRADGRVANVRTDTAAVLGVVGKGYKVFQNAEAFDFVDALVGDKLAMFETAGSLKGGRRIWMLARIPREYRAGRDDVIHPYVLLINSHDGSTALRMIATSVRVVCQNTLNLSLREAGGSGITIRHRASLDARVREARSKLGIVAARFDKFDQELHAMLARTMDTASLDDYFEPLLPQPKTERQESQRLETLQQWRENFDNDRNTLPGIRHTAWAAYNAVSEWADHQRRFRGKGQRGRAESRLASVWFGASHRLKQSAYRRALQLAA